MISTGTLPHTAAKAEVRIHFSLISKSDERRRKERGNYSIEVTCFVLLAFMYFLIFRLKLGRP